MARKGSSGFQRIGWAKGVKELWLEWVTEIRGMPSTDDRALWIRAPENALRLATVEAYYRGVDVVDIDGWRWARAVVELGMRQLVNALRQNMSEDLAAADLADAIRAEFQKEKHQVLVKGPLGDQQLVGQLTHGAIRKLCERKTPDFRKIDQAIGQLITIGEIVEVQYQGPGRPTTKWQWHG